MIISEKAIQDYILFLKEEEKSPATIEKYLRDIQALHTFIQERSLTKVEMINFKNQLLNHYKSSSINSMLISIHGFLDFLNLPQCKVKLLKIQPSLFITEEREMSKLEYHRLLKVAREQGKERLYMLLQTICATGIRVSEHKYITVESLNSGKAIICNKGKIREVIIPDILKNILKEYCQKNNIETGTIFVTRNGKPLNRSNIWTDMKKLGQDAQVNINKVFPHNLRHLFALTYYNSEKDLARLADILGHSSVETTRIYTKGCSHDYTQIVNKMKLTDIKENIV